MIFEIGGVSEEIAKEIDKFLFETTDIGNLMIEMTKQHVIDFMIYGYNPWDYISELELNTKKQGFLK